MLKQREAETNNGIQDKLTVEVFNQFAKNMRDKGWNNVDSFIKCGITKGNVLEIGPGPGYVGLELLKREPQIIQLTGCEISGEMIKLASQNAAEYGLQDKVRYIQGNCMNMPFDDNTFDAVISNGSLHEWEDPVRVFNEIERVLKTGGLFCIADMRRDVNDILKRKIYYSAKPEGIRAGFLSSLNASYTVDELDGLLKKSSLTNHNIKKEIFGLYVSGKKTA